MIELDINTKDFCAKWLAVGVALSLVICAILLPIVYYRLEQGKSDNEIAKEAMKCGYEQEVYEPRLGGYNRTIWVQKKEKK
jgi:hypothetical protein